MPGIDDLAPIQLMTYEDILARYRACWASAAPERSTASSA